MAAGKWIPGLSADMPSADAARRALTVRLELVRDLIPAAVYQSDEDPEHVHQLRVATRRARAALDIFASCLPGKAYKKGKKELRDLRRAAGEARDWDVFLMALAGRQRKPAALQRPGLDLLTGYALSRRLAAQDRLLAVAQDHPFASDRLLAETVAAVHRPHDDTTGRLLIDLARPTLSGLLAELDAAAGRDLHDYTQLHRVRIAGKRLRYAMEVFADCFEPAFKEKLYPAVEEMQEILGNANDSHVAAGRLAELRDRATALLADRAKRLLPGIEALLRFHDERLPKERGRFERWWAHWQKTGGEAAFVALLKKASGVASAPRAGAGR
jgi:CHAD domain-containing protein